MVLNLCQIKILQMNFINQLLENLEDEEEEEEEEGFIIHLKTIFVVLI